MPVFASGGSTTSMSTFLSSLGEVVTATISNVVTIANTIVSTPLLLFTTGILFTGACVGILGRFLSRS